MAHSMQAQLILSADIKSITHSCT